MAILKNMSNDTHMVLTLKLLKDVLETNGKPEWIGYDLKILIHQNSKTNEFLNLCNTSEECYFDNLVTPEIPALCDSLDLITYNKINTYSFEPIDEKDFCLEVVKEDVFFRVNLFMEYPTILEKQRLDIRSKIGLSFYVTKEDVINFSFNLRQEYKDLLSTKLLFSK